MEPKNEKKPELKRTLKGIRNLKDLFFSENNQKSINEENNKKTEEQRKLTS